VASVAAGKEKAAAPMMPRAAAATIGRKGLVDVDGDRGDAKSGRRAGAGLTARSKKLKRSSQ